MLRSQGSRAPNFLLSTAAPSRWIRTLLKSLGPGVITGAADDDPSGIATYSIAGAQLGTKLLWTALLTWPLMAAVQTMCARIGKVTGQGLAAKTDDYSDAPSGLGLCQLPSGAMSASASFGPQVPRL